jgi:hypothetical protein
MNHSESKLDELLRQLPKPEYDLDGWLAEDEEAAFDRILSGRKARTVRMRWPWVAAAASLVILIGVAAVMKFASQPATPTAPPSAPEGATIDYPLHIAGKTIEAPSGAVGGSAPSKAVRRVKRPKPSVSPQPLLAQEQPAAEPPATSARTVPDGLAAGEPKPTEPKPVVLTERDIPITRPENYHYTPEELALMRRQADEAYLKWMQLELEIAKYNQEQTAQQ